MAGETTLTVVGNMTADPELRVTGSGTSVASFTVASSSRRLDPDTNEWVEASVLFMRCSAWRKLADNVAETFRRGDRVIVTGRLNQRSYETSEGEKRTVMELDVQDVAASVLFHAHRLTRAARSSEEAAETARHRPAPANA